MDRYREGASLALLAVIVMMTVSFSYAQYLQEGVTYAPNRIVVAFAAQYSPLIPVIQNGTVVTGLKDVDDLNRQYGVINMWPLFPKAEDHGEPAMAGFYSVVFNSNQNLESVLNAYDGLAEVEHVEPVGIHRVNYNPNDPYLSSQWAITKIQARSAWDQTRGDSTVPLAIADTGVDWDHPDLNDNIWINSGDTNGDGIDNDNNGYIDDYHGWDWVTNVDGYSGEDDQTPDNNPMDFNGHGTHCSGIASAETNNSTGIAGVGFNCTIMALRIGWTGTDGNGYVGMDFAASAMYYAGNKGAKAINCSWGSSNSGGIGTAANYASSHGVQIVSAAGNDGNNVAPYLCSRSDVIAVAATDQTDHKAGFSNYGSWVDVSAPGVNIRSTYFNNTYEYLDGTSMAAPHVVGIVGLVKSIDPSMTRAEIQARIIATTDDIDAINPSYAGLLGSGRVNAYLAVNGLGQSYPAPILISPVADTFVNSSRPRFTWTDTSTAFVYNIQIDQSAGFSSPDVDDQAVTETTYVPSVNLPEGVLYWRVRGGDGSIWSPFSEIESFRIDTHGPSVPGRTFPADGSWTNQLRPDFRWTVSSDSGGSGVYQYFIQVDNDSLFAIPRLFDDSTTLLHLRPGADLPSGTRLYWRVRASDEVGNYGTWGKASFGIDVTAPGSPIGFAATPDGWTPDPNFTLTWSNPADQSGIAMLLYKLRTAPVSAYDTSGHFGPIAPAAYVMSATDSLKIYVWLADSAGNASYTQFAVDTMRYDGTPPSGCRANSPSTSGELAFTVSWSGESDIGSGLSGMYDIRYRDDASDWTDWQVQVPGHSAIFTGEQGHTYSFEARTSDLVGNFEQFIGTPESQTLVDTTFVGPAFLPGDANGNDVVNGLDVVFLVNYLKGMGPAPPEPILRADANGNCVVNGLDAVYLVNFFKGGPAPFAGNCR